MKASPGDFPAQVYPGLTNFVRLVALELEPGPVALVLTRPGKPTRALVYGGLSAAAVVHMLRGTLLRAKVSLGPNLTLRVQSVSSRSAPMLIGMIHSSRLRWSVRLLVPNPNPQTLTFRRLKVLGYLSQQLVLYLELVTDLVTDAVVDSTQTSLTPPLVPANLYLQPLATAPALALVSQRQALANFTTALQSCLAYKQLAILLKTQMPGLLPGLVGRFFLLPPNTQTPQLLVTWGEPDLIKNLRIDSPGLNCHLGHGPLMDVCTGSCAICHGCDDQTIRPQERLYCFMVLNQGKTEGLLQILQSTQAELGKLIMALVTQIIKQIGPVLERLRLLEDLHNQALHDPLTGLLNRRYMEKVLTEVIEQNQANSYQVSCILADIDHFKQVNDTYGHQAGDQVLKAVSMLLRGHVRPNDIICRYGGEEFCVILLDTPIEVAQRRAEKMRQSIRYLTPNYGGQPLQPVTISLGIATFPDQGTSSDTLIAMADKALYWAKNHGRNQVVRADQIRLLALQEQMPNEQTLKEQIPEALSPEALSEVFTGEAKNGWVSQNPAGAT